MRVPASGDPELAELQSRYEIMIDHFYKGYAVGLPDGRAEIETAATTHAGLRTASKARAKTSPGE